MKKKGLPPVADSNSRVLILGTFPGPLSLELSQYYAHPRNIFWRLMASLSGLEFNTNYRKRIQALKSSGIALWDVLESCERAGAADNRITNPVANNFEAFFQKYKQIEKVLFNGRMAEGLYRRLVKKHQQLSELDHAYAPSTSPANA